MNVLLKERKGNLSVGLEPRIESGDFSLKRNTAFIKRLKNINKDQFEGLAKEAELLRSSKFVAEIVSSILENKWKRTSDIRAGVLICGLLHRRYEDFSGILLEKITKQLTTLGLEKEKDDEKLASQINYQTHVTRFLIELFISGILSGSNSVFATLSNFIEYDKANPKKYLPYLSCIDYICKAYAQFLFGSLVSSVHDDESSFKTGGGEYEEQDQEESLSNLLSTKEHTDFLQLLTQYFDYINGVLQKSHNNLKKLEKLQNEFYSTKGDLNEEQKEKYAVCYKRFERINSHVQSLATLLSLNVIELSEDISITRLDSGLIIFGKNENAHENTKEDIGNFSTVEERQFYESFPKLDLMVPKSLLQKTESENSDEDGQKKESEIELEEEKPLLELSDLELSNLGLNKSFIGFFKKLLQASSSNDTNKLAIEFCYLNTKNTRKRLAKEIFLAYKKHPDLIRFLCRFLATLNPFFPDIVTYLTPMMENQFKYFQKHHSSISFRDPHILNVKMISEMVKFGIMSHTIVFLYLKTLLDDFFGYNIQIFCTFLENCGNFLYKKTETHPRIANLLEIMNKKKVQENFDHKSVLMIESAFYQCVPPPEKSLKPHKIKTPQQLYLENLLFGELSKSKLDNVYEKLRKFPWKDETFQNIFQKYISKIWKFKHSNINLVASLLAGISKYHLNYCLSQVDRLIEQVQIGLEENIFKHNQKRLSVIKFIGELYNYRVIEAGVILNLLYTIVTYGHENGFPTPGYTCLLDSPQDCFRIRLCCTLLNTCGQYFEGSKLKRNLDKFLIFFQYYILTKSVLSIDMEFLIIDTLESLRPKMKIFTNISEVLVLLQKINHSRFQEEPELLEEEQQVDNAEHEQIIKNDIQDAVYSAEYENEQQHQPDEAYLSEVSTHATSKYSEEDLEFEAELNKMMSVRNEARPGDKKVKSFDLPVPVISNSFVNKFQVVNDCVKYSLLTKKKNKTQIKEISFPKECPIVLSTKNQMEINEAEKLEIKNIVLNYEKDNAFKQGINEVLTRSGGGGISFSGSSSAAGGGSQLKYYVSGNKLQATTNNSNLYSSRRQQQR